MPISNSSNAPNKSWPSHHLCALAAAGVLAVLLGCSSGSSGGTTGSPSPVTTPAAPTGLAYSPNPAIYTLGVAIPPTLPTWSGGAPASFSVSPALPQGLTLDPTTGVLTGTPSTLAAEATYTVTASNAGGSAPAGLTIAVNDVPPAISYGSASFTFTAGVAITPLAPVNAGGAVCSWVLTPALPPGLSFQAANGTITGTPSAASPSTGYAITASNSGGACTVTPLITVLAPAPAAPAPPVISVQPQSQSVVAGQTASFSVTASASGTLTYQWALNGAPINGATSASYVTPPATVGESGALLTVTVTAGGVSTVSYAATLTVTPAVSPATTYSLMVEPDAGLGALYDLINSATRTIDLTMYEFNGDTTALNALLAAQARGVNVRVILDTNGEKSNNLTAYNALAAGNVAVHWANPVYAYTHQKTLTVDGATSAILTFNLTGRYYATSRDYGVIENDPADVAAIEATFQADFTSAAITPPTGTDLVWSPTNARASLLGIINGATASLMVEQEEMADSGLQNALASALARKVAVTLVVENESNDYTPALTTLKAAGAHITVYTSTASTAYYIHAKTVLADYGLPGAKLFLGSENFSTNSLNNNRELGLIFNDPVCMTGVFNAITSDIARGTAF